jgi:hypothetical protein
MSVVPASGAKSPTTHSDSEAVGKRDAAAPDYPANGGKEEAREPCHFLVIFTRKRTTPLE